MQFELFGKGVRIGQGLRAFAQRQVDFALGRFAAQVARVSVRIEDINGPKGGIDQSCRVAVALRGGGEFFAGALECHAPLAIRTAIERAGRRVARRLLRVRRPRREYAAGA